MKKYLPLIVLFLFLITTKAKAQKQNGFDKLKSLVLKECSTQKDDSLRVVNLIDSINKKFKVKKIAFVTNKTNSNHFIYPGGIMYISDTNNTCSAWIGELVHAKQFSEKPVYSSFKAFNGFLETFLSLLFMTKSEKAKYKGLVKNKNCPKLVARFWAIYERQYKSTSSFEGEAHKIFEPEMYPKIISLLNGY